MTSTPQQGSGFGLGLRADHYTYIVQEQPKLDWFEAISENFIATGGKPRRILRHVREHYPIALHGVGLSIASLERPSPGYLRGLRQLAEEIQPLCVSDHLCWTRHRGHNSHDLLPIAFTQGVLKHVSEHVDEVQERLGRRLYLENASAYIAFAAADMSEADFFAELCRATGCGIILDVNNLYVNAMNLGTKPSNYLAQIDPEWVGYMHLAGHSQLAEIRVDTHDAPVDDAVWSLYTKAVQRFPRAATLLEWDGRIPEFSELRTELSKAESVHDAALSSPSSEKDGDRGQQLRPPLKGQPADWTQLTAAFWTMATGQRGVTPDDGEVEILAPKLPAPALVGINVYAEAYVLRLREALAGTFPTLLYVLGQSAFNTLCKALLVAYPPREASIKYVGKNLAEFLRTTVIEGVEGDQVPQDLLADIAAFEWITTDLIDAADDPSEAQALTPAALTTIATESWEDVRFTFTNAMRLATMTHAVAPIVEAVSLGEAPARPEANTVHYLFYRQGDAVAFMVLTPSEAACLDSLNRGATFSAACQAGCLSSPNADDEESIKSLVASLGAWVRAGLVIDLRS